MLGTMRNFFILCFFCLMAAGCAESTQPTAPFAEADFLPYKGSGTSTISGRAFVTTAQVDDVPGNDVEVQLIPSTAYTIARFTNRKSGQDLGPLDARLAPYIRTTMTDTGGRFRFDNVPAGDYYVSCSVVWQELPEYSATGKVTKSRTLLAPTSVGAGQSSEVELTE
jgi:hypothetical protein